METAGKIVVVLLAFAGFILASYIRDSKKKSHPLVCPLEGSCETVVHSDYSKLFGIPVELLGMLYYGGIGALYSLFIIFPWVMPLPLSYIVLTVSILAFIFSIYLTAVQAFIIHHWCTWCLFSAGICTLIFIIALIVMNSRILNLIL